LRRLRQLRAGWWADWIRSGLSRPLVSSRVFCGQDFQGSQSGRRTSPAADEVQAGHQCEDRQDSRPRSATDPTGPRRRGDRMIKRREFITLLGVAAAWPLAARAQQRMRMSRIGILTAQAESDPAIQGHLAIFTKELRSYGWSEGHNLRIETRMADG